MSDVIYANRVHEACSGTGSANLTLLGALSGKATFTSKITTGSVVPYVLLDGNGVDWEVGFGTLASATELQRTTVKDSSATADRVNSEADGTPVKISLTANQHEVFIAPFDKTVFSRNTDGGLSDPSAVRAAIFVDTIAAMTALAGLEDGEAVIVMGGAALADGDGGVYYWDADDATAESPPSTYEHDTETGLFKRVRFANIDDDAIPLTYLETSTSLASNSDTRVPSTKAVKAYADALIAANDAMVFKGVIDCSTDPNYPAADRGDTYRVSVAGKIGGASGLDVEAGDLLLCLTDSTASGTQAGVGASWTVAQANIDGVVTGPGSSTDGHIPLFDGTSGRVLRDGLALDTDDTLTADSDTRVPSQSAVKGFLQGVVRGAVLAGAVAGLFTADGANFFRQSERVLLGVAAQSYKGTNDRTDGATFMGTTGGGFNAFWMERSSQTASGSTHGGIGVYGFSRKSDRYLYEGSVVAPWTVGASITSGDRRAWAGKIYEATTTGTTGASAPTHTSSTASDGGVTWLFLDYSYTAPIGVAGGVLSDISDGSGAWAFYGEAVRANGGGTTYVFESDVGNDGSNVSVTPYGLATTSGMTIGFWIAAGKSAGVPTNPSTAAIVILKNSHTFNSGIVFGKDALTGADGSTGTAEAIGMGLGHLVQWYASDGVGARIYSTVAATANRMSIQFLDGSIRWLGASNNVIMSTENVASSANYIRVIPATAGNHAELRGGSLTETDVGVTINTKGAGTIFLQVGNTTKATIDSTGILLASDDAYGAGWNGSLYVPTKNAIYDAITGKWQMFIPARDFKPRASNGCSAIATKETTTNKINVDYLAFADGSTTYAYANVRLPKRITSGAMVARVHWSQAAGASAHGVVWSLYAIGYGDGDAYDAAPAVSSTVDTGGTAETKYVSPNISLTVANFAAQDYVQLQIARNGANGSDTLDVAAHFEGLMIEFDAAPTDT